MLRMVQSQALWVGSHSEGIEGALRKVSHQPIARNILQEQRKLSGLTDSHRPSNREIVLARKVQPTWLRLDQSVCLNSISVVIILDEYSQLQPSRNDPYRTIKGQIKYYTIVI